MQSCAFPSIDDIKGRLQQLQTHRDTFLNSSKTTYIPHTCETSLAASPEDSKSQCELNLQDTQSLDSVLTEFLSRPTNEVRTLNIIGDTGCGKSTAIAHVEELLWSQFNPEKIGLQPQFAPLWMNLKTLEDTEYTHLDVRRAVLKCLGGVIDTDHLAAMREYKVTPVYLLDGYNELGRVRPLCKDLFECGISVVTCRTIYIDMALGGDLDKFLTPLDQDGKKCYLKQVSLRPFTKEQIKMYLHAALPKSAHALSSHLNVIHALSSLEEIITNPFFLSLLLKHIPTLAKEYPAIQSALEEEAKTVPQLSLDHTIPLSLVSGYVWRTLLEHFISEKMTKFSDDGDGDHLPMQNFSNVCQELCENLAFYMLVNNPEALSIDVSDLKIFEKVLECDENQKNASCLKSALLSIPLRKVQEPSFYGFAHKSVWQYFLARRSMRLMKETLGTKIFTQDFGLLLKHSELFSSCEKHKQALLDLILDSRVKSECEYEDRQLTTAASNAISILNFGSQCGFFEFNFGQIQDWTNIRVPYANLNQSQIIGCNFDGADLSNATMIQTYMHASTFRNANMRGIDTAQKAVLKGHTKGINCISVSPDGQHLASGSLDGHVRIWDLNTFTCLTSLEMLKEVVGGYDEDEDFLEDLDGHEDEDDQEDNYMEDELEESNQSELGKISLLSNSLAKIEFPLNSQQQQQDDDDNRLQNVTSVAFSPDGTLLASSGINGIVHVYDTSSFSSSSSTYECIATFDNEDDVYRICFSPDSKLLATLPQYKGIQLWDINSKKLIDEFEVDDPEYATSIWASRLSFSPDGKRIVSTTESLSSSTKAICLWNVETLKLDKIVKQFKNQDNFCTSTCFSDHDGQVLIYGCEDGTITLYNLDEDNTNTNNNNKTNNSNNNNNTNLSFVHDVGVGVYALSVDSSYNGCNHGHILASASRNGSIKLWDLRTEGGERGGRRGGGDICCLATFTGHLNAISDLTFVYHRQLQLQSTLLASCSYDGKIILWDPTSRPCIVHRRPQNESIVYISFLSGRSTANHHNVLLADCKRIQVLNLHTGACIWQTQEASRGVEQTFMAFAISHNGRYFAYDSNDDDYHIKLIDISRYDDHTQRVYYHILKGHSDIITSLCFHPNDVLLASSARDGFIKLWDIENHNYTCIMTLELNHGIANCICFNTQGDLLASVSMDYNQNASCIELWHTKTGKKLNSFYIQNEECESICFHPDGDHKLIIQTHNSVEIIEWFNNQDDDNHSTKQLSTRLKNTRRFLCCDSKRRIMAVVPQHDDHLVGFIYLDHIDHIDHLNNLQQVEQAQAQDDDEDEKEQEDKEEDKSSSSSNMTILPCIHSDVVYQGCFSSDGAYFASVACNGSVIVWDLQNEKISMKRVIGVYETSLLSQIEE